MSKRTTALTLATGLSELLGHNAAGHTARAAVGNVTGGVSVTAFGADPTGVADSTTAFQGAADSGAMLVRVPVGTYKLTSTVEMPVGVVLEGEGRGSKIVAATGGTFKLPSAVATGGFLFFLNATSNGSTWSQSYPNMQSGGIKNLWIDNVSSIANLRGVYAFGGQVFEELKMTRLLSAIHRAPAHYSDSFECRRVLCQIPIGSSVGDVLEYQLQIHGQGDGLIIEGCHFPYDQSAARMVKGVELKGTIGGELRALICGDHKIYQCDEIAISGCHLERGQLTIDSSNVVIISTAFFADTRIPLTLAATDAERFQVVLRDTSFWWLEGDMEWAGSDVQITTEASVRISNCRRLFSKSGGVDKSQLAGIKIEKSDASALTAFNEKSFLASGDGLIDPGYIVAPNYSLAVVNTSFPGLSSAAADSTTTWQGTTGTYYYQAQLLYDTTRLLGRASAGAEVSVALTNGGSGARLLVDFGSKPRRAKLRLYRGPSTGSYDYYVIIDAIATSRLYDNGSECNGHAWVSRAAAAVDTINSGSGDSHIEWREGLCIVTSAAVPTVGTFTLGDQQLPHSASTASPVTRRRCVLAGTPGTWRPESWLVAKNVTGSRPTVGSADFGVAYLDTTLDADGLPIFWQGTKWIKADGTDA